LRGSFGIEVGSRAAGVRREARGGDGGARGYGVKGLSSRGLGDAGGEGTLVPNAIRARVDTDADVRTRSARRGGDDQGVDRRAGRGECSFGAVGDRDVCRIKPGDGLTESEGVGDRRIGGAGGDAVGDGQCGGQHQCG
jgi:hypothetical protein